MNVLYNILLFRLNQLQRYEKKIYFYKVFLEKTYKKRKRTIILCKLGIKYRLFFFDTDRMCGFLCIFASRNVIQ